MFIRKCLNFDYNAVLKPLDCESFTNIANIKKKDLSSVSFCVVFLFLLQHIAFCIPNKCNILTVVCKPLINYYIFLKSSSKISFSRLSKTWSNRSTTWT